MQGDDTWQEEWLKEREAWGWLGKPPDSVIKQRGDIWEQWIHLSKRAKAVASMRYSKAKVQAAKEIDERRQEIVKRAEKLSG